MCILSNLCVCVVFYTARREILGGPFKSLSYEDCRHYFWDTAVYNYVFVCDGVWYWCMAGYRNVVVLWASPSTHESRVWHVLGGVGDVSTNIIWLTFNPLGSIAYECTRLIALCNNTFFNLLLQVLQHCSVAVITTLCLTQYSDLHISHVCSSHAICYVIGATCESRKWDLCTVTLYEWSQTLVGRGLAHQTRLCGYTPWSMWLCMYLIIYKCGECMFP